MEINYADYKILVVDDVDANVLLLKVFLTNQGFNIITADNGVNAVKLVESEEPDLVLLDVLMPEMNGFEACRHIRDNSKNKDIPIIFLTALEDAADIVQGFKYGGDDYVTKPFNWDVLMVRIKHQLALLTAKRIIIKKTKELEETIVARDKMYSVIAHDLRSPMASIKMITNMLTAGLTEKTIGEDFHQLLHDANEMAEDIFSLLDNLLKWTKSQSGSLVAIAQKVDIVQITEGIVEVYRNLTQLKNISIELDSISSAEVLVDIDMFKTCIRNLLSNATKFSFNNSRILVGLRENKEQYIISVQDFGCGIKKEDAEKLLRTETHFSTYGTAQEEGSGLGLLLVQDFAKMNHGRLWFDTEENKGSTFYLSIPKLSSLI